MSNSPSSPEYQSAYEALGGEVKLREIIDDFIDRVVSDMMIGFFFRKIDKFRLKELEFQFASTHLGGPHVYEGRPLTKAHAAHAIMGGQFNRRLRILETTLNDHHVDSTVCKTWLAHNESLRSHITRDTKYECQSLDETTQGER